MKSKPAVGGRKAVKQGHASHAASKSGKNSPAKTPPKLQRLLVEDEAGKSLRTVSFDQTPEVLFRQQSDRVTWLYFHNHKLVAAVQTDAPPADLDSYEACRANWPAKVRANNDSFISEASLANGCALQGKFTFFIAHFNPALYGTLRFWLPLEDELDLKREEIDSIKEIAERESPSPTPMDTSLIRYFERSSGIDGTPTTDDLLIASFIRQMENLPKGTAKIDVMKNIAREECARARTAPRDCQWLRHDVATKVHRLYVSDKTPDRKMIEGIAASLERRLNRALAKSCRPQPDSTTGHSPDKY